MRKPRDYDAELKALEDKAKELKNRKVQQLGELVIATGADALTADELAGALIVLAETTEAGKREAWAKRGAAFFQSRARRTGRRVFATSFGLRVAPSSIVRFLRGFMTCGRISMVSSDASGKVGNSAGSPKDLRVQYPDPG